MESILKDHRRHIGDFEVVEIVDEAEIAALRSKLDVGEHAAHVLSAFVAEYGDAYTRTSHLIGSSDG